VENFHSPQTTIPLSNPKVIEDLYRSLLSALTNCALPELYLSNTPHFSSLQSPTSLHPSLYSFPLLSPQLSLPQITSTTLTSPKRKATSALRRIIPILHEMNRNGVSPALTNWISIFVLISKSRDVSLGREIMSLIPHSIGLTWCQIFHF
jgi:hypothetical protein